MKVFLSWSGTRSHKVALVFRNWLPSVIQTIEPYVSSEDIDKGARWSTDIAMELEDSSFGILCVTRENINAPWLTFEAGALSKTMDKSFVSPFLFDIKRSEVDGPILQFQSTIFERDDLKKLVKTLNKACDKDGLADDRLEEAFDVWYPPLEKKLNELKDVSSANVDNGDTAELQTPQTQEILEEILELSRINQKLIRNSEGPLGSILEEMNHRVRELADRLERSDDPVLSRSPCRIHPMILDDLRHHGLINQNGFVGVQMVLALLKNQLPWIYDAGIETINTLRSRRSKKEKQHALEEFNNLLKFTSGHPMVRELYGGSKAYRRFLQELPCMLERAFIQTFEAE